MMNYSREDYSAMCAFTGCLICNQCPCVILDGSWGLAAAGPVMTCLQSVVPYPSRIRSCIPHEGRPKTGSSTLSSRQCLRVPASPCTSRKSLWRDSHTDWRRSRHRIFLSTSPPDWGNLFKSSSTLGAGGPVLSLVLS